MKEHPILFSAPMVRAILEGRKTQTRRVIKPQPIACDAYVGGAFIERRPGRTDGGKDRTAVGGPSDYVASLCPYGQFGARLWVRETVWIPRATTASDRREGADTWPKCIYSADTDRPEIEWMREMRWKQRPSIHMPRWASRITLEITDVRVQCLQDINEADAIGEGCKPDRGLRDDDDLMVCQIQRIRGFDSSWPVARFVLLWDSINGKKAGVTNWNANPWVWALTFKRVEQPA